MKMLGQKQHEERKKFSEQIKNELQAQKEQMNNMMEANMERARNERQDFMQENQHLKKEFLAIQKANEDNMKMVGKLRDMVAKQEEEKRRISIELEKAKDAKDHEDIMEKLRAKHKEDQDRLRRDMEAKMEANRQALAQGYQQAVAQARVQQLDEMQEKLDQVGTQLEEIKKPWYQKAWSKFKEVGSAVGGAVVDAGAAVARTVKDNCLVM